MEGRERLSSRFVIPWIDESSELIFFFIFWVLELLKMFGFRYFYSCIKGGNTMLLRPDLNPVEQKDVYKNLLLIFPPKFQKLTNSHL